MLNTDMHKVVEPGIFELMVGPSSDQTSSVNLAVTGPRGETGLPLPPPPPAGSESGLVSNFDDLKVAANYGSWMTTSDSEAGGKSTSSIQTVASGATGSKGALKISGEIVAGGAPFNWAGVFFYPGPSPDDSANLSSKKTLSFWAKGDGKNYAVAVQTESNQGQMPAIQPFTAGPEWNQYSFTWSAFKTDGSDVRGIAFARAQEPGKFEFEIDEVEIK
jgi:Complex I intermediate-associated protein 30 (CIA30)